MSQPPPPGEWTREEVSLHNKADDCWTIVHGRVYNVTKYLDFHPGGSKFLMKNAGKGGCILTHLKQHFASAAVLYMP